jgi:carboxylate-amine ligase
MTKKMSKNARFPLSVNRSPERPTELTFRPSPQPTLGVELELLIVDPRTRDLAPGSLPILDACSANSVTGVSAELMQSMIEVKAGVCDDVAEVCRQLVSSLQRMHEIATSLGYGLALGGTHPFHQTSTSVVFPDERYERVVERLAWLAYQRVVFGLHVHVGVPGPEEALGVMTLLTPYLPHLLALSANSPYWHAADTGLASSRAALYNLLPHAGLPPYFDDWQEFGNYCRVMEDCKVMRSFKDVYWDIRPRPDLGTVEFRICDMPANLADTLGLVALTRCLVIWALRVLEEQPERRRYDQRRNWIGVENKWLATRYGLAAPYIDKPDGTRRRLVEDTAELIERLLPIARETGDATFLAPFRSLHRFETGSERQRRLYRASGSWEVLMDHLVQDLTLELDAADAMHRKGPRREQTSGEQSRDPLKPWDIVDEASWASFPASDPPSWSLGFVKPAPRLPTYQRR